MNGVSTIAAITTRISIRATAPNSGAATRTNRKDMPQSKPSKIRYVRSRIATIHLVIVAVFRIDVPSVRGGAPRAHGTQVPISEYQAWLRGTRVLNVKIA